MNWITRTLGSSVGKKLLMAMTGLGFIGFLAGHLAGNLTIYFGQEAFDSYAAHLHALGILVRAAEVGLLLCAMIHIGTGLVLYLQNGKARPQRYCVNKSAGGRTLGSRYMPYTGIVILAFVLIHLVNFHFVDKTGTTIFAIVSHAFQNPFYVGLYTVAMLVVAVHVSHGFWSAFQTLGINHGKYMPVIRTVGWIFTLAVGIGFGLIPVFIAMVV